MILRFGQNQEQQDELRRRQRHWSCRKSTLSIKTLNCYSNLIKKSKHCTVFILLTILNFVNSSTAATLLGYNERQVWNYLKDVSQENVSTKCANSLDRVN